jgi:hypothetical protein
MGTGYAIGQKADIKFVLTGKKGIVYDVELLYSGVADVGANSRGAGHRGWSGSDK